MSARELPVAAATPASAAPGPPSSDAAWLRAARRARLLSWASLGWMAVEGVVGLLAGVEANALSVLVWAASSFVEGLASLTIVWRFTGGRLHSATSERTAQRWVAGSFLLLVPYFLYEAGVRLVNGSDVTPNALGIAVTASAIVLMPLLGRAKLRLSRQLGSSATAGEGVQNLLCAAQAAAALAALIGAGAGLSVIDPIAALAISAVAVRECVELWRGDADECCAPVGFGAAPEADRCCADGCCEAAPEANRCTDACCADGGGDTASSAVAARDEGGAVPAPAHRGPAAAELAPPTRPHTGAARR